MSDVKLASATLTVLRRAMDEIAREIGTTDRSDPKRGRLLEELSEMTKLRTWLKSEASRSLAQPMDELAHEFAVLRVSNRTRLQIIAEIIPRSHSLEEH